MIFRMEIIMSGKWNKILTKDRDFIFLQNTGHMKDSGKMERLMAMEWLLISLEISYQESIKMTRDKGKA